MQKPWPVFVLLLGLIATALIGATVQPAPSNEPFAVLDEPKGRLAKIWKPELVMPVRGNGEYVDHFERYVLVAEDGKEYMYDPETRVSKRIHASPGLELESYNPKTDLCFFKDEKLNLYSNKLGSTQFVQVMSPPENITSKDYYLSIEWNHQVWLGGRHKNLPDYKLVGQEWVKSNYELSFPNLLDRELFLVEAPEYEGQDSDSKGQVLQISFEPSSPGVVVTTGVREAELSLNSKHLFFRSQGFVFHCKVELFKDEAALKERREDARRLALAHAKSIGVGLLLYAGDNDDILPHENMHEVVHPYVKFSAILESFTYTYTGPLELARMVNPGSIEFGYVLGPGGRAVVYADGSVKWVPDPPKN